MTKQHLATMDFPEDKFPRNKLIQMLRSAGENLSKNQAELATRQSLINQLQGELTQAYNECEYWKSIADSEEFGDDKPDFSPPPRADGAS